MLLSGLSRQVFFWLLVCITGITAVARADFNWSYRKSKAIGFRPAAVNNQTQWQRNNQTHYNRPQSNQPGFRANVNYPQTPRYGTVTINQTRPSWQQPQAPHQASYPAYGQHNQGSNYGPYSAHGQRAPLNQTRSPFFNYPTASFNQTRPSASQPIGPSYPQYPPKAPYNTPNQTHRLAPQPPNYPAQAVDSRSWPSSTNRTSLYPKLPPNPNVPVLPSANVKAPQPPQAGGMAAFSYGPGQYPLPAGNTHKTAPVHNGSSNPYANIFN